MWPTLVHVDEEVRQLALAVALLARRATQALVELLEGKAEDEIERRRAAVLHGNLLWSPLTTVRRSTLLGGDRGDVLQSVAVDGAGNVFVCGYSNSKVGFPLLHPVQQPHPGVNVGYNDALVAGAPGHGEGHNSGQAVNITAAIAVKRIMERDKLPGTIML